MIEGPEWIVIVIFLLGFGLSTYLLVSAMGDRGITEYSADFNDEQSASAMIKLVQASNRELIIHDDGINSSNSVYNNERVLDAMRKRLQECPRLRIRCLFNFDERLKLLDLAKSEGGRIEVWHTGNRRPLFDTFYKIVDGGKSVHLSFLDREERKRRCLIRKTPRWAIATRKRVSKVEREHFETGISTATRVV